MKKLCEFPDDWRLVARDKRGLKAAGLLMMHMGCLRKTHFQLVDEPDKTERRRRAADFLYTEVGSGRTVAVEFTEFTNAAVEEASSLLKRGKKITARQGVRPIERAETQSGLVGPAGSYPQDLPLLEKFVAEKISKGQLQATDTDERILLVCDATLMPERAFRRYRYRCTLTPAERDEVDHTFVILEQRSLYQLW
jgi:hypothetical protein